MFFFFFGRNNFLRHIVVKDLFFYKKFSPYLFLSRPRRSNTGSLLFASVVVSNVNFFCFCFRMAGSSFDGCRPSFVSDNDRFLPKKIHPGDCRCRRTYHCLGVPFHVLRFTVPSAIFQLRHCYRFARVFIYKRAAHDKIF